MTQFSRTIVMFILAYFLNRSNKEYVDYGKENSQLLSKVVSECVDSTPLWFKKYKNEERFCNAPEKQNSYRAKPTGIHGIKARANVMNTTSDSSHFRYGHMTPMK